MSADPGVVTLDLSGLGLLLAGIDDDLAAFARERWGAFVAPVPDAWLDVRVGTTGRAIDESGTMVPSLRAAFEDGVARFATDQGEIDVPLEGAASARLGSGTAAWRFWSLANLLAAATAYRMIGRPGAVLHGAGIVVDGRAFVLVGAEGSGKSTFARAAHGSGARIVSDDTVIVDGGSGSFELLGSPFRDQMATPGGRGRWPVAAILHGRWGTVPHVGPCAALEAEARLAANLLFIQRAWGRDERLDAALDRLTSEVPQRTLTFAPDATFVETLRSWPD